MSAEVHNAESSSLTPIGKTSYSVVQSTFLSFGATSISSDTLPCLAHDRSNPDCFGLHWGRSCPGNDGLLRRYNPDDNVQGVCYVCRSRHLSWRSDLRRNPHD